MKFLPSRRLAASLTLAVLLLLVSAAVCLGTPKPGDFAPDFSAQVVAGKTLRLSSLRGKIVLLDFWAVGCPPCRIEMPQLQRLYEKYRKDGLVVIGITQMNPMNKDIRAALKEYGVTYPVVTDPGEKIGQKVYRIEAHPTTILLDRAGKVVKVETGYVKGDEKPLEEAIRKLIAARAGTSGKEAR